MPWERGETVSCKLLDQFLGDISIPELPSVVTWAEENIEFPPRVSPNHPGKFRSDRMPYMRQPLEDFRDPGVNDIILCWGAQCAKTTTISIGVSYRIDRDPLPVLWVMPNESLGRSWSSTRWQPLVDANLTLARWKPGDSDHYKLLEMHFERCTMNIVGSNSPANLASRPAGIVVCDEACKFAPATQDEASAMDLADQRTKTFGARALRVKASTPTIPEHQFWLQFLASDQRYYHIPCLHCGQPMTFEMAKHTLRWSPDAKDVDGRWDLRKVRETAAYHCPRCDGPHRDRDKPGMLLAGDWVATNPRAEPTRRGYHLNSFYSPDVTFATMAAKFIESEDLFGLQDFYNGWLALPWENRVMSVTDTDVMKLRLEGHRMGKIPVPAADLYWVGLFADPGETRTHWTAIATGKGGEQWILAWGTTLTVEDLDEVRRNAVYTAACGATVEAEFGIIDSGDFTMRVYDFCQASRGFWSPSKGQDVTFGSFGQANPRSHPGLVLYSYADFQAKLELYERRVKRKLPPLLHLPEDAGAEIIDGLSGQSIVEVRQRGGVIRRFKKLPNDHYGDCVKLGQLAWWVTRLEYEPPEE